MAAQYFRIIMGGIVFHVVSLAINAAQRGSGKTNLSMRTNVASSAVNIVFNWLLITGNLGFPALGVTGAAAATVLGSAVGCGMSVLSLFAKDSFLSVTYLLKHQIHVTLRAVKAIVNFASNVLVENILIRLGYMATALMAARLGAEALAAHNVGLNLLTLSFSVGDGIQGSGNLADWPEPGPKCSRAGEALRKSVSKSWDRSIGLHDSFVPIGRSMAVYPCFSLRIRSWWTMAS